LAAILASFSAFGVNSKVVIPVSGIVMLVFSTIFLFSVSSDGLSALLE